MCGTTDRSKDSAKLASVEAWPRCLAPVLVRRGSRLILTWQVSSVRSSPPVYSPAWPIPLVPSVTPGCHPREQAEMGTSPSHC